MSQLILDPAASYSLHPSVPNIQFRHFAATTWSSTQQEGMGTSSVLRVVMMRLYDHSPLDALDSASATVVLQHSLVNQGMLKLVGQAGKMTRFSATKQRRQCQETLRRNKDPTYTKVDKKKVVFMCIYIDPHRSFIMPNPKTPMLCM
ncbi:uncharacterized protein CLUP02_12234 [Colletotrichum lupini]|uniref:Uncharacterized protein n=1 Tax=Colletotrichum lupini TaxID=145971 RepID=A0A9Q8T1V0_9PEZI|nr:uncharacterized protein CLUP02_12234 [Colletotrichum lupini]UQC86732.1 hypothetical protein CLUP02_12234 [Colletotrichum lupini]